MGIRKLKKAAASVLCSCVMFVSMITPVQCGVITDTMPAYTDGFAKGYLFEGVHDWNQCEEALQNLTPAVTFFSCHYLLRGRPGNCVDPVRNGKD